MTTDWRIYDTVREFRTRVRRAVDAADGTAYWEQRDEIKALRGLVAELLVEGARLRGRVAAEARVFPDRPCETCGKPCQYPPECRECSAEEDARAKRASDR